MKSIAIIGAGFYGCYIASKLSSNFKVRLYEKNSSILQGAISNNQHRLHYGFHYPRCSQTIDQVIESFDKFKEEFKDCCISDHDNLYFVHKNSKIGFEKFCSKFKKDSFNNYNIENNIEYILDSNEFSGCISTNEQVINLKKLKDNIRMSLSNVEINTNFEITEDILENLKNNNDFVINSTYIMPNLGKNKKTNIFKFELCLIPVYKINRRIPALTVMDGDFVSVYPTEIDFEYTFSSVKYTPIIKSDSLSLIRSKQNISLINKHRELIKNHCLSYFNIDILHHVRDYVSIKCKPKYDDNATRESFLMQEENYISLYCGKISAATKIIEKIKEIVYA